MEILYCLIALVLFLSSILVKKTDKKISIITTVAITAILALCYNIFVCYILDKIKIPITLLSLTIINLAISAGFIIKIAKDKQIQQYTIGKRDIIFTIILLAVILLIAYKEFGFPLIGEFYLYKVLILFDLTTLFLMGLLFYSLVRKNNKEYFDIFMHHSFFNILHNRVSSKQLDLWILLSWTGSSNYKCNTTYNK